MSFSPRGLCRSSSKVRYPVILCQTPSSFLSYTVVHISTLGCVNKFVFICSGPVFLIGLWSPWGQGPRLLCLQLENLALSIQAGTWKAVNKNEWVTVYSPSSNSHTSGLHVKSHSMGQCNSLGFCNYRSIRTSASWGSVSCVFIAWVSSGLTSSHGGGNHWWLWHPLFTYMAGNIPLSSCSVEGQCWRPSRGEKTQKKAKGQKRGKCEHFNQGKGNGDVVSTRDAQEYSVPGPTVEESVKDESRIELFFLLWPTNQFYLMGQRW